MFHSSVNEVCPANEYLTAKILTSIDDKGEHEKSLQINIICIEFKGLKFMLSWDGVRPHVKQAFLLDSVTGMPVCLGQNQIWLRS